MVCFKLGKSFFVIFTLDKVEVAIMFLIFFITIPLFNYHFFCNFFLFTTFPIIAY